ncbi:MAG: hypothetical protein ACE5DL_02825 [Nitrosopumilaceae archaeon]
MKTILKSLLVIIPILVIVTFLVIEFPKKSQAEENYQVGLSGIKKQYLVGEEGIFSLFLTGYGSECGSFEIRLLKNNEPIEGKSIDIDCSQIVRSDFENLNIDIVSLEWVFLEPGEYTVLGEFSKNNDKKNQDEKTFSVIQN